MRRSLVHVSGMSVVLVSMILAGFVGIAQSKPASAVCTGRTYLSGVYYFAGYSRTLGAPTGGVYAQIRNVNPYIPPGAASTTAWVMLSNQSPHDKWAQIGWVNHSNGGRNTLIQVKNSASDIITRQYDDAPQPPGSYPYYSVQYDPGTSRVYFYVNGNPWPNSVFAPYITWTPYQGTVAAETQNRASQIPGLSTDYMGVYDAQIYYSGIWSVLSGIQVPGRPSWAGLTPLYGGTNFYTWDTAC